MASDVVQGLYGRVEQTHRLQARGRQTARAEGHSADSASIFHSAGLCCGEAMHPEHLCSGDVVSRQPL